MWVLRLIFKNPYSIQFEAILFLGSLGIVGTICYFILIQKMTYFNLEIASASFYVALTIVCIIIILVIAQYQINKYSTVNKETHSNKDKRNLAKYGLLVALAPAVGYVIGQNLMKQSEFLMDSVMVAVFLLFMSVLAYISIKFTLKYYFMKVNIHLVKYDKPSKEDRKGVVIK